MLLTCAICSISFWHFWLQHFGCCCCFSFQISVIVVVAVVKFTLKNTLLSLKRLLPASNFWPPIADAMISAITSCNWDFPFLSSSNLSFVMMRKCFFGCCLVFKYQVRWIDSIVWLSPSSQIQMIFTGDCFFFFCWNEKCIAVDGVLSRWELDIRCCLQIKREKPKLLNHSFHNQIVFVRAYTSLLLLLANIWKWWLIVLIGFISNWVARILIGSWIWFVRWCECNVNSLLEAFICKIGATTLLRSQCEQK